MNIEELKKDLEELKELSGKATRSRIKDIFSLAQHRIETDIINLEIKHKAEIEKKGTPSLGTGIVHNSGSSENKRYLVDLHGYAWDQSEKFVKIFVTLDGVQKLTESDVTTVFTDNSMLLTIKNLNNKDYRLVIKNFHSKINIESSYQKIKTDMVAIYIKKKVEGENWSHLTLTEKRSKDIKDSALKTDDNELKDDPTAGIMNLMKKMYQSGDTETKKMIAKAWTESQEKSKEHRDLSIL